MITPEIVEQYFPKAVRWATEMEKAILESGHRLSPEHKKDAEVIGIHRVDDVRTVVLNSIPLPTDPGLEQLVVETELITYKTSGITFGHESIGDLG